MVNVNPKADLLHFNNVAVGNYYDWTDPANPKGSAVYGVTQRVTGEMPVNLSHPYTRAGYTTGGPWVCEKIIFSLNSPPVATYRAGYGKAYYGSYRAQSELVAYSGVTLLPPMTGDAILDRASGFGAEVMVRLRPDRPSFDFTQEIVELRDLRSELQKRYRDFKWARRRETNRLKRKHGKRFVKKVADDYIAINFGWIPLWNTIANFWDALENLDKRVDQVIRDANRPVRRSGKLHTESSDSNASWTSSATGRGHPNLTPLHVSQCYAPGYNTQKRDTYKRTVWFSGRSRYRLPKYESQAALRANLKRRLLGANLSFNQIWNMIPWSWFIDWFFELGTFLQAIEGGAGEAWTVDYAYIMDEESITRYDWRRHKPYQSVDAYLDNDSVKMVTVASNTTHIRMCRSQASIFGWGLKEEDLTPYQLSILGALSLSRP